MRAKRAKAYKKVMSKYQYSFGHRPPYQILLDDQFIVQAAANKMRLGSMLESTVGGEAIKPMITQCCIRHLYDSTEGTREQKEAWIDVAKQAERRRCGHHELEQPLSTLECLLSVVDPKGSGTNRHRYVVASQEREVRARMREIAGVPLVYINRSVMILEPMAEKSQLVREADERGKLRAGLKGRRTTEGEGGVKRKRDEEDEEDTRDVAAQTQMDPTLKKRRVKGPKGPNPLSVRKTKKAPPKSTLAREVEEERGVIRQAAKKDPQAAEKAVDVEVAVREGGHGGKTEGSSKRKRKRRPREGGAGVGGELTAVQ